MNKMQPDASKITISDNLGKIRTFISEVILEPRKRMLKWSAITNQTPNLKIGYPGQHLASLILGMKGTGTGARGDDIVDGTEVKSCSRIDQLDKCKDCKGNVLRSQTVCPKCGSSNIKRNDDSKWLIAVRSEAELEMYLRKIPRMLFVISDYPRFESGDFSSMRIRAYEIWNQSPAPLDSATFSRTTSRTSILRTSRRIRMPHPLPITSGPTPTHSTCATRSRSSRRQSRT